MSERLPAARVDISSEALEGIRARALKRHDRLPSRAASAEAERRHILGVAGEQAVLKWLRHALGDSVDVRDAADSADGPSDIEVISMAGALGIEVKTTTYDGWLRHGRLISLEQVWSTDAEIYVWCAGPDVERPSVIHIVGWSHTSDVRRDYSDQRYTRARERPNRQSSVGYRDHRDGRAPEYGLDDIGFDDHEWRQSTADGSEVDPDDEQHQAGPRELLSHRDPLATLLRPPEWSEGSEPRPGFGPPNAVVRANASIRPLAALADWIVKWSPQE